MKFDGPLKLINILKKGMRDIPHTFKLIWSLLSSKQSAKKNIVGRVNRKIVPSAPKQISVKDVKGISSRRIIVMIVLLFIVLASASTVLWRKLTTISNHYSTGNITIDTLPEEEKKEPLKAPKPSQNKENESQQSRSSFLPPPTIPQSKPEGKKEAVGEKEAEPAPVEHPKPSIKKAAEERTSLASGFRKQPYVTLTNTVMDTINPQFLLENPVTSNQQVAIIVSGLGLNTKISDSVVDQLPLTVTLAVSPYTVEIDNFIEILKLQGFEVLMGVLLEDGKADTDLGWMTFRTKSTRENKEKLLDEYLDRSRNCIGFYAEAGHMFLKSYPDVTEFLELIQAQKNFIIAPPDVLMNQFHKAAAKSHINYAGVTLLAPDTNLSSEFISFIKRTGYGILAFDIKTDGVVEKIIQWIRILSENKISVVPISDLLQEGKNDIKSNQ
ncbi:MAG: divergent polysaccharide deacetylase family protein [Candidatus Paracaedibacteraceae bacterium]|nr:divergent polysaccharide deacetylase family protein [Candidatus Paracaedibacteraceae bacterium]